MKLKQYFSCKRVFYFFMVGLIVFALIYGIVIPEHPYLAIMFWDQKFSFSDFFSSLADAYERHPYERGAIYPALSYVFYWIFSRFIPLEAMSQSLTSAIWEPMMHMQMGQMAFLYYTLLTVGLFAIVVYHFKAGDTKEKLFFVTLLLMAEPVMFTMERGNLMILTIPFVMLYLFWNDADERWKREVAYWSLAIAASLKIYPAFFGLLLLCDKRWKDAIRTVIYGIIVFALPFLAMGGFHEILTMFSNIFNTNNMFQILTGLGYKIDMATVMKFISYHSFEMLGHDKVIMFFKALLVITMLMGLVLEKRKWKKILMIALPIILLPGFSYTYNVLFLLPSLILFLDRKDMEKTDWIYTLFFILSFAPILITFKDIFASNGENWGYTFRTFLYGFELCLMALVLGVEIWMQYIKMIKNNWVKIEQKLPKKIRMITNSLINKEAMIAIIVAIVYFISTLNYFRIDHVKHQLLQRVLVIVPVTCLTLLWIYFVHSRNEIKKEKVLDSYLSYRYPICFSFLLLFGILGIHGFSLGVWGSYIPFSSSWTVRLWGTENPIQSDVWAIGIPQFINQIHNGFPMFNYDMMSQGGNVTLGGMPGMGLTFIGQPHFWGGLLGVRFGLAWLYWFRKFALLLATYEVFLFLLNNRKDYSFVGALVITTCPVINWWFGHTVTTTVIYAFWSMACVINYLKCRDNLLKKIGCAILGVIGAIGFVFGWYPALQVPFGYLILIISIAAMFSYKKETGYLFDKTDVVVLLFAGILIVGILGQYLYLAKDSIEQLTNTAYPGKRISVGGEYSLSALGYYAFQHLIGVSTMIYSNNCEASSVVPFLPIILILVPVILVRSIINKTFKRHLLMLVLYIYELFILSWAFVKYPVGVAKYTFFSYVSGNRVIWSLGIISVLLGMMCLIELVENNDNKWKKLFIAVLSSLVSVATLIFITEKHKDEGFITCCGRVPFLLQYLVAFGILFIFYIIYSYGRKKSTLYFLVGMSIFFEVLITPIEMGGGELTNSALAKEIQLLEEKDQGAMWVAEGGFLNANLLYAQGVRVFNTTNQYMDSEKWEFFKEKGAPEEIYNRYAQVNVVFTSEETSVELPYNDQITIHLNLRDCQELGIEYIMTGVDLEDTEWSDMVDLLSVENISGQRFYKVISG